MASYFHWATFAFAFIRVTTMASSSACGSSTSCAAQTVRCTPARRRTISARPCATPTTTSSTRALREVSMRTATLLLICGTFAGCYRPTSPDSELVTVEARIEGLVTSASGPVAGANVELGQGGHFSLPIVHTRSTTDRDGRYALVATMRCGWTWGDYTWVRAAASGFQTREIGIQCSSQSQRIDISLRAGP